MDDENGANNKCNIFDKAVEPVKNMTKQHLQKKQRKLKESVHCSRIKDMDNERGINKCSVKKAVDHKTHKHLQKKHRKLKGNVNHSHIKTLDKRIGANSKCVKKDIDNVKKTKQHLQKKSRKTKENVNNLRIKNNDNESNTNDKCSAVEKIVYDNDKIKQTTKQRLQKKRRKLKELRKRREQKGMLLLPEKTENRIYRLKSALRKKGTPGDKIKEIVRKERRKEENKFKKIMLKDKAVCFHCRKPGHHITNCPGILEDVEQGTGICFKCGSTEHKVNSCLAKTEGFPYAKCFICGKLGHLSRSCPKNDKGLYPHGGCCNECGKIDHLKKDCPELKRREDDIETVLPIIRTEVSADAEIDDVYETVSKKKKIVKF